MKTVAQILDFLQSNWLYIVPLVEALLRIIPTKKNISIIDNAWKLLNFIVTNRRKPDGSELITSEQNEKVKNFVQARISKHVLKAILILCSFSSFGQTPITTQSRGYFSYNASDTASLQATRLSLQTITGNAGGIYFDKVRNKWRIWDGTQWTNLTGQGGGAFWKLAGTSTMTADVILNTTHDMGFVIHNNIFNISDDLAMENLRFQIDPSTTFIQSPSGGNAVGVNTASVDLAANSSTQIQLTSGLNSFLTYSTFTSTATKPGFNWGTLAGDPSTTVNGDGWYNSTAHNYRGKRNSTNLNFVMGTDFTTNLIAIANGTGTLTNDSDLSFTGGTTLNTASLAVSSLTNTRIPIIGSSGLLGDDADLTFTGGNTLNAAVGVFGPLTSNVLTQFRVPVVGSGGLLGDVSSLTFTGGARLNTNELSISQGQIISGTYTPTVTPSNKVTSTTPHLTNYMRVGNTVTVSGYVDITPSATGSAVRITMSLPVTSNFTSKASAGGSFCQADTGLPGAIQATASGTTVTFSYNAVSTSANTDLFFTFTYLIE